MLEDLADDGPLFDECNDLHLISAAGTPNRVRLINLLQESAPSGAVAGQNAGRASLVVVSSPIPCSRAPGRFAFASCRARRWNSGHSSGPSADGGRGCGRSRSGCGQSRGGGCRIRESVPPSSRRLDEGARGPSRTTECRPAGIPPSTVADTGRVHSPRDVWAGRSQIVPSPEKNVRAPENCELPASPIASALIMDSLRCGKHFTSWHRHCERPEGARQSSIV
jgi:hypothetical protein